MTTVPLHAPEAAARPRVSGGALAVTLAVALLACGLGVAVAWREPGTPPLHRPPIAARPAKVTPAVVPTPYGSHVMGVIAAVDQQLGAIRLLVDGQSYVYRVDANTIFPDRCLTRAGLRMGRAVELTLPWYLNGNVTAEALAPLHGCGTQAAPKEPGGQTNDSPPAAARATR